MGAPARLRGHHLACLHFYRGAGYDTAFVENLTTVMGRAAADGVVVAAGADEVCAACPHLDADGRCVSPDAGEAEIARLDALALGLLGVAPGDDAAWSMLRGRLADNADAWRAGACEGCSWRDACAAAGLEEFGRE
jgi:hypothetical protein